MKAGDKVRVYPHGSPDKAATGLITLLSGNQRSIAVGFLERVPFTIHPRGMVVGPDGIMLVAYREELNGAPWGPWIELFGGGHFEIEEL